MKILNWQNCYSEPAKVYITPESFAHPAKMSIALCKKIFRLLESEGMIQKGDLVVDPFGGIFTTGIIGAELRYRVIGVELEDRFLALAKANIEKHRKIWEMTKKPIPDILKGDSRKLSEAIQQATAIVTSPPFNENSHNVTHGQTKGFHSHDKNESKNRMKQDYIAPVDKDNIGSLPVGEVSAIVSSPPYLNATDGSGINKLDRRPDTMRGVLRGGSLSMGNSKGQIAEMKEGDIGAIITSPPYIDQSVVSFTADKERTQEILKQLKEKGYIEWDGKRYTEAEWRAMNHGRIDGRTTKGAKKGKAGYTDPNPSAVITSPPYEDSDINAGNVNNQINKDWGTGKRLGGKHGDRYGKTEGQIGELKGGTVDGIVTSPPYEEGIGHGGHKPTEIDKKKFAHARVEDKLFGSYKSTDGSIGKESKETYWQAMNEVYSGCHKILRPGGISVPDYPNIGFCECK